MTAVERLFVVSGLRLRGPNARRGQTRGAAMAYAREYALLRDTFRARTLGARWPQGAELESITLSRRSSRRLDDDNLIAASKAPLDGIALAFGVDDRTFVIVGDRPGIRVYFEQAKGPYGVAITLRGAQK